MLCQKLLNVLVVKQILLCQSENLKSLLFSHESTLDPKTLLCYFLTVLVAVFDIGLSWVFLLQVMHYLLESYLLFLRDLGLLGLLLDFFHTLIAWLAVIWFFFLFFNLILGKLRYFLFMRHSDIIKCRLFALSWSTFWTTLIWTSWWAPRWRSGIMCFVLFRGMRLDLAELLLN